MTELPEEIREELAAERNAQKPSLTEVWRLPVVPLDDFLGAIGVPLSTYYSLRKQGQVLPTFVYGRKRLVRPRLAQRFFESLPVDTAGTDE